MITEVALVSLGHPWNISSVKVACPVTVVPKAWKRCVVLCDAETGTSKWDNGVCAFGPGKRARPITQR
jgi:hypothetical protein